MQRKTRYQTIQVFFSFLIILGSQVSFAQLIYFNSGLKIYSFGPSNCFSSLVIKAQRGFSDIAFDRNGNLYGCSTDLNRVYLSTGSVSKIADIGGVLNGMTISYEGIIYMGDASGELISYNLNTGILTNHGNMGFGCAGDLTFYKGELYMTAFDFQIIKVNIEHPELSELVMSYTASSEILGIVSDYRGCGDTRVYGMTGGNSEVFSIDFDNMTVDLVCQIALDVLGGASTTEFLASIPVSLGSPIVVQPDCKSLTGSVSFPSSSGIGTLEFRLGSNAWQTETDFNNLNAGTYSFYLRDEDGCMDSLQIELMPYPLLVVNELLVTPATCNQADGELLIQASGGMGVLTYSLNGFLFQLPAAFTGLAAGMYDVYVKDNLGCTLKQTVEVNGNFLFDVQNYDVLNATCNQNNGTIFLYPDLLDTDKYTFSINGAAFQQESVFGNLEEGLYHIVVKHQNGCMDSVDIFVASSVSPQLLLSTIHPEACNLSNGSISTIVNGGMAPFKFRLNSGIWQENQAFNDLVSGLYVVHVQDRSGCFDSLDVFIESVKGPEILAVYTNNAQCNTSDGRIEVDWNSHQNASTLTILNEQEEEVFNLNHLAPGYYQIYITDTLGCEFDTMVTIKAIGCELSIPNIFSPNDDGINDEFKVEVPPNAQIGINAITIYDRWGNQVYAPNPHLIDTYPVFSWNGSFRGKKCPPGVYTYRILIRDIENNVDFVFGDLTLIR